MAACISICLRQRVVALPQLQADSSPSSSSSSSSSSMAHKELTMMKAVRYERYGGGAQGLKHVEVPVPSPQKDEILLKLEATALNPFDWKLQKGILRPLLPPKFPFVPAVDVTGEVVEVGPGVNTFKKGDKVVALLKVPNGGGLAEFAAAPIDMTVIRHPELSATEVAGLPTAALTALQAVKAAGIKFDGSHEPGTKTVLVTAASGGVGHYAVQLAKLAGVHVTATCGARNIELVKSLGADEALDYKTPEGAALRSPASGSNKAMYDAVIHCATGIAWSTFEPNLSSNGKVIDITPSLRTMISSFFKKATFARKQLVTLMSARTHEDLQFLVDLVKEGKLRTVVDSSYPLSRAEEAWAKSMSGHATGKIIVENAK